ncbi:hypothetical protein T440DRAFT_514242 [Plenodomus tracheiphilus IPT5]|uniref:Uncharacterized protein n=1 Tax=Plenodomus tracheiphilus IPT5 TaxID=1408161 RepID=A0A6A7BIE1_9PLEO|nr:hypothetical protein T440DRAFT_514242 [Plenodomus tracheiphilus IPT5]
MASGTAPQRPVISRPCSTPAPAHHPSRGLSVSSVLSIVDRITTYVSHLFDSEPTIIEYSNAEIVARTSICIKAEWVQYFGLDEAKKMLRLVALVKNGDAPVQTKEMVARPKRVKEILRKVGVKYLAEDVYKKEIFKAMRKLKSTEERVDSVAEAQ